MRRDAGELFRYLILRVSASSSTLGAVKEMDSGRIRAVPPSSLWTGFSAKRWDTPDPPSVSGKSGGSGA